MSIRDAVGRATAYLREHPDEARYRDSPARARLIGGLRVEVVGPTGERLETDMPTGIGGTAGQPSPGWYFRAAIASCVTTLITIRAATEGIRIDEVEVVVDSESDDRGILGLDPAIAAGPLSARIEVGIRGGGDEQALDDLVAWAVAHCPVSDALARPIPLEVRRI